jgi:hypothetical protein
MLISDLTYLEVVAEDVSIEGGWGGCFPMPLPCLPFPRPCVTITGHIQATGNVEYFGLGIAVNPAITGNSAKAEGNANAYGNNTYTFVGNNAVVGSYSSMSNGVAVASAV